MKKIQIIMPQMGQSVAEGKIIQWKKQVGEAVQADEVLLEVETDKTTVDVESPATGRLAICLKQAGETAAAGEVIGVIEMEVAEEAQEPLPVTTAGANRPHASVGSDAITVSTQMPSAGFNASPLQDGDRDRFSPYVMRLAMLNSISLQELKSIKGTGRNGRTTKYDILQYVARRPVAQPTVQSLAGKEDLTPEDMARLGEVVPMTTIRRTIADHMVQSIRTSAHVTMVHAVDMTHLVNLRERIKDGFQKKYNAKLTYTGVMLFVTSRVLKNFPVINASVCGTNLILRKNIHIGCAVALPDESLVVPVVRNADQRDFPGIAQELDRLIAVARKKALTRADVENGTFTISNFGAFGSLIGTPLINQPQVAILGMGAVFKTPVVVDNQICIRDQLYLSFSFDHRVIDGAMGGRFLNAIQKATEALTEEDLNVKAL
jgi:2-oxoglutarate dehydrogenase E2 component (dihydrolipoamide succinyltransferase)